MVFWVALLVAASQPSREMSAEDVVRRHLEALGGEANIRALRTLKKTGSYVYNGHEHRFTSYHASGRRNREA